MTWRNLVALVTLFWSRQVWIYQSLRLGDPKKLKNTIPTHSQFTTNELITTMWSYSVVSLDETVVTVTHLFTCHHHGTISGQRTTPVRAVSYVCWPNCFWSTKLGKHRHPNTSGGLVFRVCFGGLQLPSQDIFCSLWTRCLVLVAWGSNHISYQDFLERKLSRRSFRHWRNPKIWTCPLTIHGWKIFTSFLRRVPLLFLRGHASVFGGVTYIPVQKLL